MSLKPNSTRQSTWLDIHSSYEKDTFDKNIYEYSFDLNYKPKTVYKNFNYDIEYKALIAEGVAQKNESPYKRFQSYPYEKIMFEEGDYITFKYGNEEKSHWLLGAIDKGDEVECIGKIYKCNNWVKYIYDGKLYKYPCYFPVSTQRTDFYYNNSANIVDGRDEVWVQRNEITLNIKPNDRFLFDGVSYKVVYVQKHNNVSLEEDKNIGGIIVLKMIVSEAQDIDDKENNIAMSNPLREDKESTIKEEFEDNVTIKISPNVTKILRDNTQTYTCIKYVNGVATNELLSIVDNSTMRSGYYDIEISENTFTVHNIKKHTVKKVEIQISDNQGNVKDLSITLGGDI